MPLPEQALVLARVAQSRSKNLYFSPKALETIFLESGLPLPSKISNILSTLKKRGFTTKGLAKGTWRITPLGSSKSIELISDIDLSVFSFETKQTSSLLGHVEHTTIPPQLSPPEFLARLRGFLQDHPFECNVFGMTRFPNTKSDAAKDPVAPALEIARQTCKSHGLEFHLASDRALSDDLWGNVTAHMWGCQYGIAFFEDRIERGLNYNLTIEVGSMLMAGRRCALLKDTSAPNMPTDLVGKIYKNIDLQNLKSVQIAIEDWITNDLNIKVK